jgi:acetolactate decarboxylase
MSTRATAALAVLLLLFVGCAADGQLPSASAARDADARGAALAMAPVQVHGALRAMFHEGQTGTTVTLDSLLPDRDVYAVGALSDLAGEITILAGHAFLSRPDGAGSARTEEVTTSDAGATLLVAAEVDAWQLVSTPRPIPFDQLDEAIAELAVSAGLDPATRIPFLMEGEFDDLRWHVIDGSRLVQGGSSHEDHQAASVREGRDRTWARLVGFYSRGDQGVFTHKGSWTHVHCVVEDPTASGHVDHVVIPAGTTVRFPLGR